MRILVVEDDARIAALLRQGLEDAGYATETVGDGEAGLQALAEGRFDVVLLDVMLPGVDGMSACRRLRARGDRTPVLMLTARDAVEDRVRGLDCGADDYLSKPFDFRELLARVRALGRREQAHKASTIRIADLEIDTRERRVRRAGTDIALSHREFELLSALATHERRVYTREMVLAQVWESEPTASNVVDAVIKALRKKIDADHAIKLIHTVWGVGYVLRGPEGGGCDAP